MLDVRIATLARSLDQAFDQRAWHGPNLLNALRGVTTEVAAWRPQAGRHNIWELAVHAAYWKYRILRYVAADPPDSFGERGSDWIDRPAETTQAAWKADVQLLKDWHAQLRTSIDDFDPDRLDEVAYDRYTHEDLLLGAAAHDLYHAGQIRLLRRMQETL